MASKQFKKVSPNVQLDGNADAIIQSRRDRYAGMNKSMDSLSDSDIQKRLNKLNTPTVAVDLDQDNDEGE